MEMGQFTDVTGYVSKSEQRGDASGAVAVAKLHYPSGLDQLLDNNYKLAAQLFVDLAPEFDFDCKIIRPQDVATYGGLCALATFDRSELKSKVIDNINFRDFLELAPEIRELIHDFYGSRYASCLEYLGDLKKKLLSDMYMRDHVETLCDQIRNKALIQYTRPYVSVDLHKMANAFNTAVAELEKELAALIGENQIQARIDSQNKILYARPADERNATFQRVLQTGNEFDHDARAMLLRANLLEHEYMLRMSRNH